MGLTIAALLGLARANALANPPATSPSTKPHADAENPTAQWQVMPKLPSRPINKVVHFTESNGVLTADWPILASGPVDGRFSLTDLPGEARIQCFTGRRMAVAPAPMFEYYDLSQPGVCRHLQVLNPQSGLQVVQDYETDARYESVSLIENLNDSEPVTLRVQILDGGQQSVGLAFPAHTLAELRQDYPNEFEKYLRPMFRQFHQEGTVFAVEDKIAWQVMAEDWQPPADLAGRVKPLVQQLDAPDFSQRQQAQDTLHELGQPAALFLHAQPSNSWSSEQKARVHKFLAEYFVLTEAQATKLGADVDFLLDCLASDDADLRSATLRHLEHLLGRKIEYKLDEPPADRMTAIEQLRRQLTIQPSTREAAK
jgi:hypothetical protein